MTHFDYDTRMGYYLPQFSDDKDIDFDPNLYTNGLIDRAKYGKYATMCVNYELKKKYGLMAQTEIEYCLTNQDENNLGKSEWRIFTTILTRVWKNFSKKSFLGIFQTLIIWEVSNWNIFLIREIV